MKRNGTFKVMMVAAMVVMMGTAGSALAYRGWGGSGQGDWECPGDGYGMKRGGGPGHGYGMRDLSREDVEQMNQLREKFFDETAGLRSELRSKSLELRSELAKENPDIEKAKILQKELSALEAQMDQKRIEHQLEMRKVNPNAGRGYHLGYGPRGERGGYGGCRQ